MLMLGDCIERMKTLPDCSVDAVVTDPPYGLAFMGKKWDYDVPAVEVWAECLRVLKPGGHLLAFAGTRTQHRMAVRIEDAGFEIRDMIAWVYGSGFPKSLDVSKAIDKMAGADREVLGPKVYADGHIQNHRGNGQDVIQPYSGGYSKCKDGGIWMDTAPATDAARQWQGWGTALKPAIETVTFASKPYTDKQELDIIQSNLFRLEVRLWLLSPVSAAVKSSTSSQSEFDAACVIAQWSADEITSTQAALCDQMGTSLFELATTTSLNIVSSWRRTLDESWSDGNTSTTETKLSTTIDWRTLKFSLSQITPASIIKACSLPGGFSVNASTAENHFNASLSLLQSIRTLSATEPAISQEAENCRGADVKPNLDPCIMARKPLTGTVAENVLKHGTGAINVDGCRVDADWENDPSKRGFGYGVMKQSERKKYADKANGKWGMKDKTQWTPTQGRWPANLIHSGEPEVVGLFPETGPSAGLKGKAGSVKFTGNAYNNGEVYSNSQDVFGGYSDSGSAARFFYCAKASKADRDEGCEGLPRVVRACGPEGHTKNATAKTGELQRLPRCNHHPTVKPTALMRYLCRLVTPPDGIVLDPFMGSGSTGKGAILEGFRFIGIEREAEYMQIAEARIRHATEKAINESQTPSQLELEVANA